MAKRKIIYQTVFCTQKFTTQQISMNSLIWIVGVILSGKENYQEWFCKGKNTLIFNDMWDGICEKENLDI